MSKYDERYLLDELLVMENSHQQHEHYRECECLTADPDYPCYCQPRNK